MTSPFRFFRVLCFVLNSCAFHRPRNIISDDSNCLRSLSLCVQTYEPYNVNPHCLVALFVYCLILKGCITLGILLESYHTSINFVLFQTRQNKYGQQVFCSKVASSMSNQLLLENAFIKQWSLTMIRVHVIQLHSIGSCCKCNSVSLRLTPNNILQLSY